jgi:hypothetical protein
MEPGDRVPGRQTIALLLSLQRKHPLAKSFLPNKI